MFRKLTLGLAAALGLTVLAGNAQATVMVDPGMVGSQANNPLVDNELFLAGQTTSFHYVFSDMRHIEATRWGFILDDQSAIATISWLFYLTDEFGQEIDNTRADSSGQFPSGALFGPGSNVSVTGSFVAHDFFIEITTSEDILVDVFVEGLVGEWAPLPEPATLALFGVGLAGLGIATRRSRRHASA